MYDIQLVGNGRPAKIEGDRINVYNEDMKGNAYITITKDDIVVYFAPLDSIMAIEKIGPK
jgi:hypothetical protein